MGEVKSRVARDSHGERTSYEDIEVGKDLGVIEWVVTPEAIDKQCKVDEDYHEWFMVGSPLGYRLAPPQIQYRPPRWLLSRNYNIRGVFWKWEFENVNPIKPNKKILVSGKIVDKWIKNDREFVQYEAIGKDEDGVLLFTTQRVHVLDVIKRNVPRQGDGVDSGIKREQI